MATKKSALKVGYPFEVAYTPEDWTPEQLAAHRADSMEGAFKAASCLSGGWYHRAVTIDYQVTATDDERYMIRPSEVPVAEGWEPAYTVARVHA